MESLGILDPSDDIHLFCLHYVFIPRINRHLMAWKERWMKHSLRSERGFSPEQLWTHGLQKLAGSSSHLAHEIFESISEVLVAYMYVCMQIAMFIYHIG